MAGTSPTTNRHKAQQPNELQWCSQTTTTKRKQTTQAHRFVLVGWLVHLVACRLYRCSFVRVFVCTISPLVWMAYFVGGVVVAPLWPPQGKRSIRPTARSSNGDESGYFTQHPRTNQAYTHTHTLTHSWTQPQHAYRSTAAPPTSSARARARTGERLIN